MNSIFVITEISILLSSKQLLKTKFARKKRKSVEYILAIKKDPSRFLSTIQVGITLMSMLIGLCGGTIIAVEIKEHLEAAGVEIGEYMEILLTASVLLVITYVAVLGEIIPKRIAILCPEVIAVYCVHIIRYISILFSPIVFILSTSTNLFIKVFKLSDSNDADRSSLELKAIVQDIRESKRKDDITFGVISRAVAAEGLDVGSIMTPRQNVKYIESKWKDKEVLAFILKNEHSFFPIMDTKKDEVLGILSSRLLFSDIAKGKKLNLKKYILEATYVPDTSNIETLFNLFKKYRRKFTMVVDEYGSIEGIVTLNDALNSLMGGAGDRLNQTISLKDGRYIVSGDLLITELKHIMNVINLPGEEKVQYRNISAFLFTLCDGIPKAGDIFESSGWVFKVLKMSKRRVLSVELTKNQMPAQEE